MIRVEQTILTPPDGNCFAACVASILELPIESVPNYRSGAGEDKDWWHEWQRWLAPKNLSFIGWAHPIADDPAVQADVLRGYSICSIRYEWPSGGVNHAVVCWNGEIVWNPHPLRGTRQHDSIVDWVVFRILDPVKWCVITVDPNWREQAKRT
jgi:hypothetical protein